MRQHDLDMHKRLEDMRRAIQDLNIEVMSRLGGDRSRQGSLYRPATDRSSVISSNKLPKIDTKLSSPLDENSIPTISFSVATPPLLRRGHSKVSEDVVSESSLLSESGGEDVPDHVPPMSPLLSDVVSIRSAVSEGALSHSRYRHSMILEGEKVTLRRERSHSIDLKPNSASEPRKRSSTMIFSSKQTSEANSTPTSTRKGLLKALKLSWFKKTSSSDSKKRKHSVDEGKVSH